MCVNEVSISDKLRLNLFESGCVWMPPLVTTIVSRMQATLFREDRYPVLKLFLQNESCLLHHKYQLHHDRDHIHFPTLKSSSLSKLVLVKMRENEFWFKNLKKVCSTSRSSFKWFWLAKISCCAENFLFFQNQYSCQRKGMNEGRRSK